MSTTKRQRKREQIAQICERIDGGKSDGATFLRRINRMIEMKKGKTRRN